MLFGMYLLIRKRAVLRYNRRLQTVYVSLRQTCWYFNILSNISQQKNDQKSTFFGHPERSRGIWPEHRRLPVIMPELLVLAGIVVLSGLCWKFLMDIDNLFYKLTAFGGTFLTTLPIFAIITNSYTIKLVVIRVKKNT